MCFIIYKFTMHVLNSNWIDISFVRDNYQSSVFSSHLYSNDNIIWLQSVSFVKVRLGR